MCCVWGCKDGQAVVLGFSLHSTAQMNHGEIQRGKIQSEMSSVKVLYTIQAIVTDICVPTRTLALLYGKGFLSDLVILLLVDN